MREYRVYRSDDDGATYARVGTPSGLSFRESTLEADTTYWWTVEAVDVWDNVSPRSEAASATTAPPPIDTASKIGRWSAPFDVGVVGVHAAVLHTGKVLLFYRTTDANRTAQLWDPSTGTLRDVSPPLSLEHNMFCSSHVLSPDGDLFVTGGTLWGAGNPNGTQQTAFFDATTETWTAGPSMASPRWYPTTVSLPDGDAVMFSGKVNDAESADEVERYDAATNSISTLSQSATMQMLNYPRMFVLPDDRIIRVGQERQTMFFDPSVAVWTQGPGMQTGSRTRGSDVLMPDLQRVLAVGGATSTGATATAEMLDLTAPNPQWTYTGPMTTGRRNFNLVMLPDAKVLAVGGNRGTDLYDLPVFQSEMYDPATATWTTMASQAAPRAYHSTAVLLPDGRVLSAGQTQGTMQTSAEIYSPPYLFAGPRPSIAAAPTEVGYGDSFTITTPQAETIDRVALIRGNTATHGVNFDQRYVRLASSPSGDGELTLAAPVSGSEAPPGWYMLFVVDDGVPSVATWVHISGS